jgi:hypothetical protein
MTCIYVLFVHLTSNLYEQFYYKTTAPFLREIIVASHKKLQKPENQQS